MKGSTMKKTVLFTVLAVLTVGQNVQAIKFGNFNLFKNKGIFTTFNNTSMFGRAKSAFSGLFASLACFSPFKKFHAEEKNNVNLDKYKPLSDSELEKIRLEEKKGNALRQCIHDYSKYSKSFGEDYSNPNKKDWDTFSKENCLEYIKLKKLYERLYSQKD